MEIKSISQKIFRTSPNRINNSDSAHSNPFGVNFKGNIISADVFETTAAKTGLAEKVSNRGKMVVSAIVGSINDVNQAICKRLDSVVGMGRKIRENVELGVSNVRENMSKAWGYINSTNLFVTMGLKNNDVLYKPKNLDKMSLDERRTLLQGLIEEPVMEAV